MHRFFDLPPMHRPGCRQVNGHESSASQVMHEHVQVHMLGGLVLVSSLFTPAHMLPLSRARRLHAACPLRHRRFANGDGARHCRRPRHSPAQPGSPPSLPTLPSSRVPPIQFLTSTPTSRRELCPPPAVADILQFIPDLDTVVLQPIYGIEYRPPGFYRHPLACGVFGRSLCFPS